MQGKGGEKATTIRWQHRDRRIPAACYMMIKGGDDQLFAKQSHARGGEERGKAPSMSTIEEEKRRQRNIFILSGGGREDVMTKTRTTFSLQAGRGKT